MSEVYGRRAQRTAWRMLCRQEAAEQAAREALAAWQSVEVQGAVPFNHRWEHVQAVAGLARWLANAMDADAEVVEAAAWLHDIRKMEPDHGAAGALAAEEVLAQTDFPAAKIGLVAEAIRLHAGLVRPDGAPPLQPVETAILWDADKLSKLGVQALALDLCAYYEAGQGLAERRHANEKWVREVLAKTVTSMNTAPARRLAEERYAAMLAALAAWEREERIEEL